MRPYRNESSDPTNNAQRNLTGRTHYVDADTLRYHKSRILSCQVHCDGLLLSIIESVAIDPNSSKRRYRGVIFDVFGNTIDRPTLDQCCTNRDKASREMYTQLDKIDAIKHTKQAAKSVLDWQKRDYASTMQALKDMQAAKKVAK